MKAVAEFLSAGSGHEIDQVTEKLLRIGGVQAGRLVRIEDFADDYAQDPVGFTGVATMSVNPEGLARCCPRPSTAVRGFDFRLAFEG